LNFLNLVLFANSKFKGFWFCFLNVFTSSGALKSAWWTVLLEANMGEIRVGIVGAGFIGGVHSKAYIDVGHLFDLPKVPLMQAACDTNETVLKPFADRFGWKSIETSWEKLVARDDIDLVDICTSNATHMAIAAAAAKAGKHILCEKPIARNAAEARAMLEAAQGAGVTHMVAHNYRRVPAIDLAKNLVESGEIGQVLHFNAVYYQDSHVDPAAPFVWRNDAAIGGSGVHGDLNAHIVDLARYLVGEFDAVCGAKKIFVKERKNLEGEIRQVTAEDSAYFLAKFQNGALGSFLATKMATGFKNYLRLEVCGTQGSFIFNLERLNELEFYSRKDNSLTQGFHTILVTENQHPYFDPKWWPGQILGWEHTFLHEIRDMLVAIAGKHPVYPDFYDGLRCQLVLDAVIQSFGTQSWVLVPKE
jgi:predicted dehydrogenase